MHFNAAPRAAQENVIPTPNLATARTPKSPASAVETPGPDATRTNGHAAAAETPAVDGAAGNDDSLEFWYFCGEGTAFRTS